MAELLETGLVLMAAGMGTVCVLLAMLVWSVRGVSRLSRWLDPQTPETELQPPATPAAADEIVTVISAAVSAYRRDDQR